MAEKKTTKKKSKAVEQTLVAEPVNVKTCAVCGKTIEKPFATVGDGQPICSIQCLGRLGKVGGKAGK